MADIDKQYLAYIKNTAAKLASGYSVPSTPRKWKALRETIRSRVIESIGLPQVDRCELLPRDLGVIEADGYTLTKVSFQTIAGVWMTGNLYKPDGEGPFAAVLCVHGHWKGAKQDPVVQARCIGLAKLGFVALSVDAFGAGEPGIDTPTSNPDLIPSAPSIIIKTRIIAAITLFCRLLSIVLIPFD